jgi:methyl-accepting chemotaxis protein
MFSVFPSRLKAVLPSTGVSMKTKTMMSVVFSTIVASAVISAVLSFNVKSKMMRLAFDISPIKLPMS